MIKRTWQQDSRKILQNIPVKTMVYQERKLVFETLTCPQPARNLDSRLSSNALRDTRFEIQKLYK